MNKETICCPLCNAKLNPVGGFWTCPNDHRTWAGTEGLWQELIKTKQKLDLAIELLERHDDTALEKIADLDNQKDAA